MSPEPVVAVLAYHRVGPPPDDSWETWFSVDEDTFSGQLALLAAGGWAPIGVDELLAGLEDPAALPGRAALVTFDDGFRTLTGSARACLADQGYPAAVFVPAGYVGRSNEWDAGTAEPEEAICDWDDLRALDRTGLSVQSHGVSHRAFSELDPDERRRELADSKRALESGLGKKVELFAYPYGDEGTGASKAVADAGYRAAFIYEGGPFRLPAADRYRLPRIPIGSDTDLETELAR